MFFPPIKRNDIWQMGHNKLTSININSNIINFKNIRDIDYINKKEKYYDEFFDLNDLSDIYIISVPFWFWNFMSHIMLEFDFKIDKTIVLSIEARRQPWEDFDFFKWFLRHFGLIYVWWSVNDLIWLRKDIRKLKVYKYKLRLNEIEKKKGFLYFIDRTNKLINSPEYYNTFFSNCTTNLWDAFKLKEKHDRPKFSKEVFFSWFLDKYLYQIWLIENKYSFEQTKNNALMKN